MKRSANLGDGLIHGYENVLILSADTF
nr:hypothetical protein I308_00641 [Cryptococcus tetragattii IND107]